jgi:hypothetical protein
MIRISANLRLLCLIAIALLVAGLASAQTLTLTKAGPNRPAIVPVDYVITPFGYFHASCVRQLAEGDILRHDLKTIQHVNGTSESMHVCAFAHFRITGEKVAANVAGVEPPTISHAWVEYTSVRTSTSSYGELSANWDVPPAPSAYDGQVVYLFPGLEDYKDVVTILQPVLGWNSDFSKAWGIASWNCCASGTVYESTPKRVNSGDNIFGTMKSDCPAGTLTCAKWNITTTDVTSGQSTTLSNTLSLGQTFNWAFAGALEVYYVHQCSDYPPNGSIAFYNLALYDNKFVRISNPGWTFTNDSANLTPKCSYGGSEEEQVNLNY